MNGALAETKLLLNKVRLFLQQFDRQHTRASFAHKLFQPKNGFSSYVFHILKNLIFRC